MQVKGIKSLSSYHYLIMFDLASKISGVCVYDLHNNKPVSHHVIKVHGEKELPSAELKDKIDVFMNEQLSCLGVAKNSILVSFEAMPTQVHGGGSTISTFIAMARSHAILDTYLYENGWDTYDYVGVYPISTHSYYRKLTNISKDEKITKEMLRDYVVSIYNITDNLTLDESDAIFLAKTLIDVKWNNDLDDMIRDLKRHKKTLKAPHAIKDIDNKILLLQSYKYNI